MMNTKKAFTLVELIVVITILAILGTIAFISLQGYSADARNTKRSENISGINTQISVKNTNGTSLMSFVSGTANTLTTMNVAGTGHTTADYNAGIINYTAIGVKSDDFKDPQNNGEYRIGVTTYKDGNYEIAASIENGAGNRTAKIVGNYIARTNNSIAFSATGTNSIVMNAQDINVFSRGDYIKDNATTPTTAKIISVSRDGSTLNTSVQLSGTGIKLVLPETSGLIKSTTAGGDTPVSNGSDNVPY